MKFEVNKLILVCSLCFVSWSQGLTQLPQIQQLLNTQYVKGVVITLEQDTLFGKIENDRSWYSRAPQVCKFKRIGEKKPELFTPKDILAYKLINSKSFLSVEIEGEPKFVEVIFEGEVEIYFLDDKERDRYFIEKEDLGLNELHFDTKIVKQEGKTFEKQNTAYKGMLRYYMQDTPRLFNRISKLQTLSHSLLIKLARDYHRLQKNKTEK
ncbi:MAG: hypothetical protein F6K19_24590 [Cyanothece sp. SIO1E1]|nr:hypothetical protein [Cyanothece sp. SIO1E1]